ncbi:MAG: tetratricopeptide repeat protein [Candidatus Aminicenantes bacterium]|nr:tetratricopeptide repeat protein [Candidatus Aminicenantes bacterium]
MRRAAAILTTACLAVAAAGFAAGGQEGMGTARLSGEVRDEAGLPLAGVRVALLHVETGINRVATSDDKGKWAVLGLGSGVWRITLSLAGYRMRVEDTVVRQTGRNIPFKSVLRPLPTEGPAADTGVDLVEEGNRLFEAGRYEEALAVYRKFFEKHPRRFQVHFNIGNCLKEMGDYDGARTSYGRVLDAVGQGERGLAGSALAAKTIAAVGEIALRRGDPAAARAEFERAISLYPQFAGLPYGIGEIYAANGRSEDALAYFELAARIKPDWPDPWLQLGRLRLKANDVENALKDFRTYLALAPDISNAGEIRELIESLAKK